jgi:hypothetical protein
MISGRPSRVLIIPRVVPLLVAAVLPLSASSNVGATTNPGRIVAQAKNAWLHELRASARAGDRAARFPSPPRAVLVQRLERAGRRYRFELVSVALLRPLQAAPVIVLRSDRKQALARSLPRIIDLFDPRHPTGLDPSGFAYEGYFLTVVDNRGTPYIVTFNHWRAPHVGGGEWAASEDLYPFPHG